MSLQQHRLHLRLLCPTVQLAVSAEGTSRNTYEITGERRTKAMCIYNMVLCSTISWCSPSAVSALLWCHVIAASSGLETALFHTKKPTCVRLRRECLQRIPVLRVDMPSLFPLSFVTLELWGISCRVISSHRLRATVSPTRQHGFVEPCQSWCCQHPNTSVSHWEKKRQKLPATKNFAFPPHPENSRSVQSYLQVWMCIPWIFYIDVTV